MNLQALVGTVALAVAACGGGADLPDGGTSTGCPLETAPGVARAVVVDGGCTYQCAQTLGQAPRYLCPGDTACRVQNTAARCGECGYSCPVSTPNCITTASGSYCSASRTP